MKMIHWILILALIGGVLDFLANEPGYRIIDKEKED